MRIAIIGTGGVGAYFGGRLAQAGEDVTFVARGAHLEAIKRDGLRVDSINGDFVIKPAKATDDPRTIGMVEVAIICTKAWQVREAAESIKPIVGPYTAVVTLQNGVDSGDVVAEVLGKEHAAPGVAGVVAFIAGPGHIKHTAAPPWLKFGEIDNRPSERLERLRDAFTRAKVNAEIAPDVQVALWNKLLFLGPAGGVGATTRSPVGVWRAQPDSRRMMEQLMDEILAVAAARGVKMPADAKAKAIGHIDGVAPEATMSMQRDIMAGKESELDAQIGAVVRLGGAAGVPTPVHEMTLSRLSVNAAGA
jgi:2-dehydropantoate 2-reductase